MTSSKPLFPGRGGLVLAVAGAALLAGCTTTYDDGQKMSQEQYRYLYPRAYANGLDPWDRQNEERRMMEEAYHQTGVK